MRLVPIRMLVKTRANTGLFLNVLPLASDLSRRINGEACVFDESVSDYGSGNLILSIVVF